MGRAGFAKISITPPLGVELSGYGVYLQRRATAVHDDLYARALLLEDDMAERVLLLALDLVGLGWELSAAIAHRAAAAAGIDVDRVLVSCTHTHSGPAASPLEGWGRMEPSYVETIPGHCAAAAAVAVAGLQPVRVGTAHGSVRALGFNRVRSDGPIDRSLHVLRIDSMAGVPQVVLFSHGCHPVSIDRHTAAGTTISADWPGQVGRRLQEEGYGEAIFRLGVCGDIDPVVAWHGFAFEGMELTAEAVTQALLAMLRSITTTPTLTLRLARQDVALPLAPLSEEDITATLAAAQTRYGSVRVADTGTADARWQQFFDTWAQAMRARLAEQPEHLSVSVAALLLGDEVWLHLPGEIFTALGQEITARSRCPVAVVTTLLGAFIGYLPDRDDFAAQGYAATLVPRILQMPPYSPAVGDALVAGALAVIERVGGME